MVTSWNNSRELVSALFFLCLSGVKGAITSPPQNTATKVGSQTYLNCSGNNSVPGWKSGEPGKDVVFIELGSSCSVSSNYLSRYRGEGQGSNTCNLIILNPSLQESGIYSCQDLTLTPKYAVLTVLSSSGTPTVSNGSEVVEGDQLTMTCAVEYRTASETLISVPIAPNLNWTTSGISITNAVTAKTNISVTSSITVVATRDGIPSYDCTAQFLPPANKPDSAPNAPSNVYVGGTYQITGIYYGPTTPNISRRTVNVTANSDIVCSFIELTCNSSANPSASYTWTDVITRKVVATNNVLALAEDNRTYQCTVSNKVNSSSATYTTGISQPRQCVPAKTDNIRIYSADANCDNGTNSCSCVNGSHVNLICEVTNAYPLPIITWIDDDGNVLSSTSSFNASSNGNYTCRPSNQINLMTNTTATKSIRVTDCCPEWKIIVSVIIPWVGECLIVTTIFLVCYATLATPFRVKMLSRFPWLDYMLPCVKKSKEQQRAAENAETTPVQSSENTCPPEKSKKKRRRGEKTTENLDSATKIPPHNNGVQSSTVPTGRPLPPKPGKLEPIKNTSLTQTPRSQSFKANAREIKRTVIDKDTAPKWKIFLFVVLLIVVAVTCGIVFFPILITIAYFSPKSKVGDGQNVNSGTVKGKPAYLIPLIILMWFGVVVFMFPLTFVLVYFVHCEQMTFRYVLTP